MNAALQVPRPARNQKPLKLKKGCKRGFFQLPFTNYHGTSADYGWTLPATGGFFGGSKAGSAMALALLKHMRDSDDQRSSYLLGNIVKCLGHRFHEAGGIDMEDRPMNEWTDEFMSLRGQYAGFTDTLSRWLSACAKNMGSQLDDIAEKDLIDRANVALLSRDADLLAACSEADNRGGSK